MLEVHEAVSIAEKAIRGVVKDPRINELMIEEVELKRDNGTARWAITFSLPSSASLLLNTLSPENRAYKIIEIDAGSGEFVSMKIRSL